jgi:hypothetical protein
VAAQLAAFHEGLSSVSEWVSILWRKRHPPWEPPKSYSIPTSATSLLWRTLNSYYISPLPTNLLCLQNAVAKFLESHCGKRFYRFLLILSYRLPPIKYFLIFPTPSSEIIINNPINTQYVKKDNIIKSTITYIQSLKFTQCPIALITITSYSRLTKFL